MRARVLETMAGQGVLIDPEAVDFILGQDDPVTFAGLALTRMAQKPLFMTLNDILDGKEEVFTPSMTVPRNKVMPDVKILEDITGNSTCEGSITDFARYFQSRYRTIRKMLSARRELAGALPIPRAMKLSRDVRIIVIVNEARSTKNGHKILEVEDEEGKCMALITKDSPLINESVVTDEVVGIVGKTAKKGDMLVVEELIRPDIPLNNRFNITDSTSSVAFLSDVHVGSHTFLEKKWLKMVDWLKHNAYDEGIDYIVFPGDVVDGIGIFPGQEEELIIDDIYQQYEVLAEYLKDLPDHLRMIVHPGNHDAVRQAEPQPALSEDFRKMFDSQIMMVGNPCWLEIEGRKMLTYHGRSIDDWISNVRGLTYDNPIDSMREMLIRRHLLPMYGSRTPLAPEKKDYMIIDRIPDIFVTGHVHGAGVAEYRGVKMINASTWQDQTDFQKMHNFNPDPAIMPIFHLGTRNVTMQNFN